MNGLVTFTEVNDKGQINNETKNYESSGIREASAGHGGRLCG